MIRYRFDLNSKHEISLGSLSRGYVFPYFSLFEKNKIVKVFSIDSTVIVADIQLSKTQNITLELICSRELPTETQSMVVGWIKYILDLDADYSEPLKRLQELSEEIDIPKPSTLSIPFVYSPDEMLISALISQNTTENSFRKMMDCLARNYGESTVINGLESHSFPTVKKLARAKLSELTSCRIGYRYKAIPHLNSFLEMNSPSELEETDNDSLLKKLTNIKGIGDYSARCFLIYHLKRFNVVFLDSWVRKVINKQFGLPKHINITEFTDFADEHFSPSPALILDYLISVG